jgi:hypothetical protein
MHCKAITLAITHCRLTCRYWHMALANSSIQMLCLQCPQLM